MKLLREGLGDNAHDPRYIELRRGRGYRVIPPVVPAATEKAARRPGIPAISGAPLLLRDRSIHNIYALGWLP